MNEVSDNTGERSQIREGIEAALMGSQTEAPMEKDNPEIYLQLIRRAQLAQEESQDLLVQAVHQARRIGHSWNSIGDVLNISRQAAQQRFGGFEADMSSEREKVLYGATAFNEMQMLETEGAKGYHLVSFGILHLVMRPSDQPWEHLRLTPLDWGLKRRLLDETGWQYVGSWFPFRYYKRPVGHAK